MRPTIIYMCIPCAKESRILKTKYPVDFRPAADSRPDFGYTRLHTRYFPTKYSYKHASELYNEIITFLPQCAYIVFYCNVYSWNLINKQ